MKSKVSFLPYFSKTKDPFYEMHKRTRYLDDLETAVDNFKAKQTLVDARPNNIKRQQMMNYQSEYDRIIGALNSSAIPELDREMLRRRREELRKLGVKAVRPTAVE